MYDAFISYSHKADARLATNLRRTLQRLGKRWYQVRASRVFRDEASLRASAEIWPTLVSYLEVSRYLIVVASRDAAASYWVNKEIEWWLENRSTETLLLVLSDGQLMWDAKANKFETSELNAAPHALTSTALEEPFWIDLRPWRRGLLSSNDVEFQSRVAALAATIRDTPKEDILSEELRAQRQAVRTALAGGLGLVVLAIGVVVLGYLFNRSILARAEAQAAAEQELVATTRRLNSREAAGLTALASREGDGIRLTRLTLSALPVNLEQKSHYADEALVGLITAPMTLRLATANQVSQSLLGAFTLSPDNGWYAVGNNEGISIYDTENHLQVDRLFLGQQNSLTIDWSDKSSRFLARYTPQGPMDDEVYFGILHRDGKVDCRLPVTEIPITARFSPDGTMALVGERDGTLRSFHTGDCSRRDFSREFGHEIRSITFSQARSGSWQILVGALNGQTALLDQNLDVIERFDSPYRVLTAAVSPDGRWIARPVGSQGLEIFDGSAWQRRRTLDAGVDQIFSLAVSPSGDFLAVSGGIEGNISIWRTSDWVRIARTTVGSNAGISAMRFLDESRLFGIEMLPGDLVYDLRLPLLPVDAALVGPVDNEVQLVGLVGKTDGSISLWRMPFEGPHESLLGRFDGERELLPEKLPDLRLGEARVPPTYGTEELIVRWPDDTKDSFAFDGTIMRLEPSASGAFLLVSIKAEATSKVVAISLAERPARILWERPLSMGEGRGELEMHTMRDLVALRYESVSIQVIDIARNSALSTLDGALSDITDVSFMADGRRIAAASRDGRARIWSIDTGEVLMETEPTNTQLFAIDVSPDLASLAVAGIDGSVTFFATDSGARLDAIGRPGLGPATAIAFSPDGQWLYVAAGGETVRRFPVGQISQSTLDWMRISFPFQATLSQSPDDSIGAGKDSTNGARCLEFALALEQINQIPSGPVIASPDYTGAARICQAAVYEAPVTPCLRHVYARILREKGESNWQQEMTRAAEQGCESSKVFLAEHARGVALGPSTERAAVEGPSEILRLYGSFLDLTDSYRRNVLADRAAALDAEGSPQAQIAQALMIEGARPESEDAQKTAIILYHAAIQTVEADGIFLGQELIPISVAYSRRAALAWSLGREQTIAELSGQLPKLPQD